ncbi:MAG: hypothetical protein GC183_10960 [Thiobacillus sp.]|nr:hypothetical protein [Thiobacillus sp.]
MVRKLLLLALLVSSVAKAASLTAQVDRTTVALGEPVTLTISASGLNLDALDLAPLDANFEVYSRTLSRGAGSEILVLTLYPRLTGAVQLPALLLETRHTAALPLRVEDGTESVPRVSAKWTLDPAAPQVNEPARLSLEICDDGSLQWQRPPLSTQGGRVLRALDEEEGTGERDGESCTLHRFDWALLGTQSGAGILGVPMLDASRFGQRLRFPGPQLAYQVVALPAWLPSHVPPVAPQIQAALLPSRWPLNRPLAWRFEVTGGFSADGLRALLDLQLRETAGMGVYPPLIEAGVPDDPASPQTRYVVTLFLQPRATGMLAVPTLRLPWYDVTRGQLAAAAVTGRTLTVFDPRWQMAGRVAAGIAGLLLLGALSWRIRRAARWRLARRRGLYAISKAGSIEELARAVRQFSLTGQPPASSLGEWQRRMQQDTGGCDVAEAVRLLERQQFGQAATTLAELRRALSGTLERARPRVAGLGWRFWR